MSPLLVLALIAVTPLLVVAQEPASITVSVRSEHNPVSNVTIEIDNRTFTSDAKGSVTINVAPGRTTIKATSPQHLPAATQLLVEAGQHYEIELELQPISHEEVTVSATRTDARLEDSPTRVEVLNREEIEEKILMTPAILS